MKKITPFAFCLLFSPLFGQVSFEQLNLVCDTSLTDFQFLSAPDEETIWGAGQISVSNGSKPCQSVTRSIDGGLTWSSSVIQTPTNKWKYSSFEGYSKNSALATFFNGYSEGKVFQTLDGGTTWKNLTSPKMFNSYQSFANFSHAFSDTEIISVGDPIGDSLSAVKYFEIWKTLNGGTTWTRLPGSNISAIKPGETGLLGSFDTSSDSIWFTTSAGRIYFSPNKGETWTAQQTAHIQYFGTFKINNNGIGIGSLFDNFITTSNSGATWSPLGSMIIKLDNGTSAPFSLQNVDYIQNSTILMGVGTLVNQSNVKTAYSLDNGKNWIPMEIGVFRNSVAMVNEKVGFLGGRNSNFKAAIWKYNDNLFVDTKSLSNSAIKFSISPNPASDNFDLTLDFAKNCSTVFTLSNTNGQIIIKEFWENSPGISHRTIRSSQLPAGIYFVHLTDGTKSVQRKVSILH